MYCKVVIFVLLGTTWALANKEESLTNKIKTIINNVNAIPKDASGDRVSKLKDFVAKAEQTIEGMDKNTLKTYENEYEKAKEDKDETAAVIQVFKHIIKDFTDYNADDFIREVNPEDSRISGTFSLGEPEEEQAQTTVLSDAILERVKQILQGKQKNPDNLFMAITQALEESKKKVD